MMERRLSLLRRNKETWSKRHSYGMEAYLFSYFYRCNCTKFMGMRCITMFFFQRSNDEAALDITMLMGDTRVQHSLGLPRAGVIRQGLQVNIKFM